MLTSACVRSTPVSRAAVYRQAAATPLGLRPACLYTAARETGVDLTQAEVSNVAGVSAVTVRNSYRELRD